MSFRVPQHVLFHELEREAVLLNLKTGDYYTLNKVGTRMWSVLAESHSFDETMVRLAEEYDMDRDRLVADLSDVIADLKANGLIEEVE